jgi:hypothetical protein
MSKLGLSTRKTSAYRPSAYGMSAPLPANGVPASGSRADKLRPDMYKLSATVRTRTSDDEPAPQPGSFPKSPNWFNNTQSNSKKSAHNTDNDSESVQKLFYNRRREGICTFRALQMILFRNIPTFILPFSIARNQIRITPTPPTVVTDFQDEVATADRPHA